MSNLTEHKLVDVVGAAPAESGPNDVARAAGYELEKKLGTGGYGEVWQATVPGGLKKAVKIVFGQLSDTRATRELKSLERIKEVRHPFVLTIERIEICGGKLVVVSELAEESLRSCFERCQAEGFPGIPRDALLQFLRDAADALDFMSEQHMLQHLDIKPENLLIFDEHCKVADFGLTKDLGDLSVSMVAGMTPQYAAPEVSQGKPGRYSDQYSLAVVYQHMLTGQPPFQGRNAAQLITQHLHSPPDLSSLPPSDQAVISRALSKNPKRRFSSCKEFVDNLIHSDRAARTSKNSGKTANQPQAASLKKARAARAAGQMSLRSLEPLNCESVEATCRPAVVIGIGGFGGRVIRRVGDALASQFNGKLPPGIRLLYWDTDENEVQSVTMCNTESPVQQQDALAIPLMHSSGYRRQFRQLTEWLSRRWLFNIPRTLRTEGIRPLGRLAFVSHYREIEAHLIDAITGVTDSTAIQSLQQATGLRCSAKHPRVFIVAATTGGTGGGMFLDAGYLARRVLSQHDLAGNGLCAFLAQLHSDADQTQENIISRANDYASLVELSHFCHTANYPGTSSAGIPGNDFEPPFANAYVIRRSTGDTLGDHPGVVEETSDYLCRSLIGDCAPMLDLVRRSAGDSIRTPSVHGFAIQPIRFDETRQGGDRIAELAAMIESTRNRLPKTRGGRRLIVSNRTAIPKAVGDVIKQRTGDLPAIIQDGQHPPAICFESTDVPIFDLLTLLEQETPDCVSIAERIQSRIDINWGG